MRVAVLADIHGNLPALEAVLHKIHYFAGQNGSSFGGGSGAAADITSWVEAHFTAQTVGGVTVYDLAG